MKVQDMSRILKGLTLVLDQVILRKQPEIETKFHQIRYHINEIFKVIIDTKINSHDQIKPDSIDDFKEDMKSIETN